MAGDRGAEPAGWWPALDSALAAVDGVVDRVELKVVLDAEHGGPVLGRIRDQAARPVRRSQVHFFDTPDLGLRARGVLVRARRRRAGGDTVVKLRRPVPDPPAVLEGPPVGRGRTRRVELDALPGSSWCSVSFRRRLSGAVIARVAAGETPVAGLLSRGQHRWFDRHANTPAAVRCGGRIEVDELRGTGPVEVTRVSLALTGVGALLTVEDWTFPDGSRLLELSTKCRPDQAAARARAAGTALARLGLTPLEDQPTKADVSLGFLP